MPSRACHVTISLVFDVIRNRLSSFRVNSCLSSDVRSQFVSPFDDLAAICLRDCFMQFWIAHWIVIMHNLLEDIDDDFLFGRMATGFNLLLDVRLDV